MKILITGGAGFIGSHLTAFHLEKGDSVYVIDNFITGSKENIIPYEKNELYRFIEGNVITFDFASLAVPFDISYHLASPASPIQYKKHPVETLQVNAQGTYNVLEHVKKTGGSFLVASTSEVYGDPLVHPQPESYWGNVNSAGVRSCYDEGKRFAEAMTMTYYRSFGVDARIVRIFNTYGPNMEKNDGRVVSNFIMQALTGQPITIYGDGTQTRSFCYVSDLVRGLNLLATVDIKDDRIINIGNPDEKTMLELAQKVKELTGTGSEIVFQPIDADDPKKRKPDITKAQTILGWQPTVSLDQGLQKTIAYFKERFI
jgi:nucleoside-diphosphate-sugar epimerase